MNEKVKKVLLILRIVMPILFILIGVYSLVFPEKIRMEPEFTKMFAYLVIGYGLFRGYRAYKEISRERK